MKKITWIIVSVIVIVLLIIYFTSCSNGNKNKSSNKAIYDCYSTASSQTQEVPGFRTNLFVSQVDEDKSFTEEKDNGNRTLSLSDYQNDNKNLSEDLFFYIVKDDDSKFTNDSTLQLCNTDNKTNRELSEPDVSEEPIVGLLQYIHGGHKPAEPGEYRVDAYISQDGNWVLTNRMNITFTE